MDVSHRKQSASRSHMRTDIGERQAGQAQKTTSPSSQICGSPAAAAARETFTAETISEVTSAALLEVNSDDMRAFYPTNRRLGL